MNSDEAPTIPIGPDAYTSWDRWWLQRIGVRAYMRSTYDRTGHNNQATMEGLSATASTITSAAAIMIIVFGAGSFSRVLAVQLMGFGLAVAVFLDATLIRMILVPAIMHVAGRWNWWPGVRGPRDDD